MVKTLGASALAAVLAFGTPAPALAVTWHYVAGFSSKAACESRGAAGHNQGNWNLWQCRHPSSRYWDLWADGDCRICLASVDGVRVED